MTPTGKSNRFPFLDILGYLKNTYKNPKFGRLRQVPTRDLGWEFPGWDLSPKLWDFYGYSLNTLKYPLLEICYFFLCPVPDNFMHQTGSLTTYNYVKTYMYTATKHLIKKAQPNFLQTTRKLEIILTLFIMVLMISFLLLSTSSVSVKFYKLTTLDKMIFLAGRSTQLK